MRRISGYSSTAILLLAFGLRVYHLSFQATMSDDALGLLLARHNPLEIFSLTATEPFPPTFYVTLSAWAKLAGTSEYAGRFYSLLFSLCAVALMYRAGRRIVNERTGLVAAFLMAINPLDIFFAQEVRMYSMLTVFSLASSLFAFELIAERSKNWAAYAITSLVVVMTHAFALFVLFAQDVAALVAGPRGWRWLRSWAACQLGVVAVFAVWVALVARNLEKYNNGLVSRQPLPAMLWRTFSAFAFGFSPAAGIARVLPALLVALLAAGVVSLLRRPAAPAIFLLSYLVVPFIVVWAISLVKPVFYERYMVICLPPALLLAAAGIAGLEGLGRKSVRTLAIVGPPLAGAALLIVAIASASHLRSYYDTVAYASRADMRRLAAYVTSAANPLVITNVAPDDPLYGYYLPPSLAVASTQSLAGDSSLARLTSDHEVLWFLPFGESDRQHQALDWLSSHTFPAGSRWFGHAQVLAFAAPAVPPPAVRDTRLSFGHGVELAGVSAPAHIQAGQPVDVTLRWHATAKPSADYSVFVHLLAPNGATVSQHDGWPAAGARPTSSWQPGQTIDDRHGLLTAASLASGDYQLEVGLYDASGKRLAIAGGKDSAVVGTVHITS